MINMIKSLVLSLLRRKRVARFCLLIVLKAHNTLYDLAGFFAIALNGGIHPKHRILRYKEWFLDKIDSHFIVLDVGSNTGSMPALMAEKARYVYGIEIDATLSKIARKRYSKPNIEFLTGDATTYNYKDCLPIDCVTLSNVLEHIEDRIDFLKRLQKGVSWNGLNPPLFLIRVPAIERDWLSVFKQEVGVEYRLDRTHKVEHTRQQLLKEISEAGLRIESFETRFGEYYVVCYG